MLFFQSLSFLYILTVSFQFIRINIGVTLISKFLMSLCFWEFFLVKKKNKIKWTDNCTRQRTKICVKKLLLTLIINYYLNFILFRFLSSMLFLFFVFNKMATVHPFAYSLFTVHSNYHWIYVLVFRISPSNICFCVLCLVVLVVVVVVLSGRKWY